MSDSCDWMRDGFVYFEVVVADSYLEIRSDSPSS